MTYELLKLGITELNVMQQDMLLAARKWERIVLLSPTGSGKTLAYLLPVLNQMDETKEHLQTLVLVPSRELAIQTTDVVRRLCPQCRVMAPATDSGHTRPFPRPHGQGEHLDRRSIDSRDRRV